jgi:hypothetical protein
MPNHVTMKINSAEKAKRGSSYANPPFFPDAIVSCLDLVGKTLAKTSFPPSLEGKNPLIAQMCYDFACSIEDRIEDNFASLRAQFRSVERANWECNGGKDFLEAYRELDQCENHEEADKLDEDQTIAYVRRHISDEDSMSDPKFVDLWQKFGAGEDIDRTFENNCEWLERKATRKHSASIMALLTGRSNLARLKTHASPRLRTAAYSAVRDHALKHYEELFDLRISCMMQLSDVAPRMALLDDSAWVGEFWQQVNSLARQPREFAPETYALRYLRMAQLTLDYEMREAEQQQRKANRKQAFYQ